jgi:oxygen-independent coproporphyrinogen-3 oxidase
MSSTLGLYISIPFCRAKCTYCNFASGVFAASEHGRYVVRICDELRAARSRAQQNLWQLPDRIGSIYLGGGTPSTLDPPLLLQIFEAIRDGFVIDPAAEITIECAPGQTSDDFLKAMVEVSATRISLGVQSMVDREATATGRMHTRAIVEEDVRRLHAVGLAVNIDLIAGMPGQTMASWAESIEAICDLNIQHASLYMLEVDEDSRLGRELIGGGARYGAGLVPTDDIIAAMYESGCARLEQAGLLQYEISNFARLGAESRHNLRYWRRQPYLGVGLDAHSMLRDLNGHAVRFSNIDDLQGYLDGIDEPAVEHLSKDAEIEEAWFLGLRLNEGVSLPALRREFGNPAVHAFAPVIAQLVEEGLLVQHADRVALTSRGRMLSNDVFARFLGVTASQQEQLELLLSR